MDVVRSGSLVCGDSFFVRNEDGRMFSEGLGGEFGGVGDSGGIVSVDLRQRTQKQAIDVRQDGGTARRDAVLGQELIEVEEGKVDALCGLEVLEFRGEVAEVIGGLHLLLFGLMLRTETTVCVQSESAALAAARSAMGATDGWNDGVSGLKFHFVPRRGAGGTPTRVVFDKECGND